MAEIGTKENPYQLGTTSLPDDIVNQEFEIIITQARMKDASNPRMGRGQVEVKWDGKRKYLNQDEYEYVCKSLDWAKDYIKRYFMI